MFELAITHTAKIAAIGMIDMATNERVGKDLHTAGLGHPETLLLESQGCRVFVKVPDDGGVVEVFDRKTGGLITKCALNGSAEYHALVLDETDHRLFTFSRHPSLMEALNTFTGKESARLPVVAIQMTPFSIRSAGAPT